MSSSSRKGLEIVAGLALVIDQAVGVGRQQRPPGSLRRAWRTARVCARLGGALGAAVAYTAAAIEDEDEPFVITITGAVIGWGAGGTLGVIGSITYDALRA